MTFPQVTRNAQAQTRRIIIASPDSLRECADRLEAMARSAHHGESVLCELAQGITVVHRPEFNPEQRHLTDALPYQTGWKDPTENTLVGRDGGSEADHG